MQEVAGRIEGWIRLKVKEANAKGVVVGMSGGVDSSVVAVLAKHSLSKNVLGLILPCESPPKDAQRAKAVAKRFRIRTENVDLTKAFSYLKNSLPEFFRQLLGINRPDAFDQPTAQVPLDPLLGLRMLRA